MEMFVKKKSQKIKKYPSVIKSTIGLGSSMEYILKKSLNNKDTVQSSQ